MKNIVYSIFNRFGYDIVKSATGLPSGRTLFSNFDGLTTAYEFLFQKMEGVAFNKNAQRASLLARLRGTPAPEAYFIINGLFQSQHVDGDVCEFGVAQGETSAIIANEILAGDKKFHLFDSFQGLSAPTGEDELIDDVFALGQMDSYKGTMAFHKNWVLSRLRAVNFPADRSVIHEGFIEDVLRTNSDLPQKVSFAYIDFDLYAPIKATLEFLHVRTQPGAVVIIDDYAFFSTGVQKAVDEFISAHPGYKLDVPDTAFGHFAVLQKTELQ